MIKTGTDGMTIKTRYNIGEEVFVKIISGAKTNYCKGEIRSIMVGYSAHEMGIRYRILIPFEGEMLERDRWEEDLISEDLTGSAMPKLIVVQTDKNQGAKHEAD